LELRRMRHDPGMYATLLSEAARPGAVLTPNVPYYAATADHVLRYTTSAGVTVYITVYGYEF
jgi:hypothetical protein